MKTCLRILILLLAIAALIFGCAQKSGYGAKSLSREKPDAQIAENALFLEAPAAMRRTANDAAEESNAESRDSSLRKLVKRATLHLRVEDIDAADSSIDALMRFHNAYASSTESRENYLRYIIRVPSEAYDAFLASAGGMGRILNRSESTEDVTLRYYDLEGRLETRQELLKTFRSYLGKAKDIDEILSVEARIAELQSDIDRTGRDFRQLAGLVDYSTITLEIYGPVASEPYRGSTLAERISELFSGFGEFLSSAAVVAIGLVMYGIPILLILVLLFWLLLGRVGLLKKLFRAAAGKKKDDTGGIPKGSESAE